VGIVLLSSGVLLASVTLAGAGNASVAAAPAPGQVVVVQAVPGAEVSVSIDGKSLARKADVGSLSTPVRLSAGAHDVVFTGLPDVGKVTTRLDVKAGSTTDVVLHQPASVDGTPVVNTYRAPMSPVGPDKARVLLAHTATAPPADVRVDGKVVFTNIANGEYADADVPAGSHRVALLPTGVTTKPILGPLEVTLKPRTLTMVYAVGNPSNGSMDAIVHRMSVRGDGSVAPASIDTGSAGLAAHVRVDPFPNGAPSAHGPRDRDEGGVEGPLTWWGFGLGALLAGLGLRWQGRTRSAHDRLIETGIDVP
jgi:hypothetical protein